MNNCDTGSKTKTYNDMFMLCTMLHSTHKKYTQMRWEHAHFLTKNKLTFNNMTRHYKGQQPPRPCCYRTGMHSQTR